MDADSNFDLDADADANPETRMWVDREKKWENMAFKFTHNCFDASGSLISLGLSEEGRLLFSLGVWKIRIADWKSWQCTCSISAKQFIFNFFLARGGREKLTMYPFAPFRHWGRPMVIPVGRRAQARKPFCRLGA